MKQQQISEEDVRLARESFQRIDKHGTMGESFYRALFARNPKIRKKFENVDFKSQNELFWHGVHGLLLYAAGQSIGTSAVKRLSKSHAHDGYNIHPDLYDDWVESLLETIPKEDGMCTKRVVEAWRNCLKPGIDMMKAKY